MGLATHRLFGQWAVRLVIPPLLSTAAAAPAKVIFVASGGSGSGTSALDPVGSLNAAYLQAGAGDVIELAGGTYGAQTVAYRPAAASWASNVTIRSAVPGAAKFTGDIDLSGAKITLSGLETNGHVWLRETAVNAAVTDTLLHRTIYVRTDNVTLSRNEFANAVGNDAIVVSAKNNTTRTNNILIEDNYIHDYRQNLADPADTVHEDGIQLYDTQNVIIRRNRITNVSNSSIITTIGRDLGIENVLIENNFLRRTNENDGTYGYGTLNLLYANVKNIDVINNTVLADLHLANTREILVRNNIIDKLLTANSALARDHNRIVSVASGIALGSGDVRGAMPAFVNAATADFRIASSNTASLAFANSLQMPATDYDQIARTSPYWVGASQVPEPAMMSLVAVPVLAALRRRRASPVGVNR